MCIRHTSLQGSGYALTFASVSADPEPIWCSGEAVAWSVPIYLSDSGSIPGASVAHSFSLLTLLLGPKRPNATILQY